jgi:hypothetical protein
VVRRPRAVEHGRDLERVPDERRPVGAAHLPGVS